MMSEISYDELQSRLERLKALDLSTVDFNKIIDLINSDVPLPILISQIHAGHYIERIRINKGNEIFTKKRDLSYRTDLENISTFGRANSPKSSMFYGAVISSPINLPRIVALAETDELLRSKEKGTVDKDFIITVSKWKILQDIRLAEMVFMKNRIATTPEIGHAYNFHLKTFRENMPEEEVQKLVSIIEFFSEEFAKSTIDSDTDYKLSAAYSEIALKSGIVKGLIYPSVRTDYEGSNVALLPEAVDNNLQLEEALIIHVQIKGKKVFLDNLARTGELQMDVADLNWYRMKSAPQEIKDKFFST
jgi:hypothetical protein